MDYQEPLFETKDRNEFGWLLHYADADYLGDEIRVNPSTGKKESWHIFANKEKQRQLIDEYNKSVCKDFAEAVKRGERIRKSYL